ncbi:MAG: ABC transporter permease [Candidatus Stahlbacteria bacterium]|nr:ABC transporter permease [Candidatus Stahlbacteria bacterium]
MQPLMYIKTVLIALKTQKLRTFLTTLGVIIGVMTVITMMSIVEGMNKYVYTVLGSLGTNTIYIQKFKWMMGPSGGPGSKEWREIAKRKDFTKEDAEVIKKLPFIAQASLTQSTRSQKVSYRGQDVDVSGIEGGTPEYLDICNYEVEKGRTFVETDVSLARNVGIVGTYLVDNLFKKGEDPLGKSISIGRYKFTIIGILKEKGNLMGQNMDNTVIIPLSTLKKFIRPREGGFHSLFMSPSIVARVKEGHTVQQALDALEELLRQRRGCKFNEDNNFELNTQQMILEAYNKITAGIFIAMIGIASLSLLVGGIGIMNIMLVSVTERTREIGIRMAIGAKRKGILFQFLIESATLTGVGGIIGVILGFGLAKLVAAFTPLKASTPLWSIGIGIGFSLLVGVFFGIYPAFRASKLNPIEALRYE